LCAAFSAFVFRKPDAVERVFYLILLGGFAAFSLILTWSGGGHHVWIVDGVPRWKGGGLSRGKGEGRRHPGADP